MNIRLSSKLFYSQIFVYILLGLSSYATASFFKINVRAIPNLQQVMYAAIAFGLYISVLSIDIESFKTHLKSIAAVLIFGVPIKIILPGFALAFLSPNNAKIAYLCSTVIAQIDPIVATQSLKNIKLSRKSQTTLSAWASFDDPITVLFAFYIFLPMARMESFDFTEYFVSRILIDVLVVGGIYTLYVFFLNYWYKRIQDTVILGIDITVVGLVFIYGLFTTSLFVPAAIALFVRPFNAEKASAAMAGIACFSAITIGAFTAISRIDWGYGFILAFFMLVAHALATQLLIQDHPLSKLKMMFSHQNGMTAILLTIGLELSDEAVSNLLPITLPAIIFIAFFYLASNYIIDLVIMPMHKQSETNNLHKDN
jgi:hypothetical protein